MATEAGEVIISVLLRQLSARAASLLAEEPALPCAAKEELRKLSRPLRRIHLVAEALEKHQGGDGGVRVWLEELSDVAYDVDDALDDLAGGAASSDPAMVQQEEEDAGNPLPYWMRLVRGCFLSCCTAAPAPVSSACWIRRRLESLRERLDVLAEDGGKYFDLRWVDVVPEMALARETSHLIADEVFGRDDVKERIIEALLREEGLVSGGSDPRQRLSVISIVGMGGIGKTVLAQAVSSDPRVRRHFQSPMWVYVGETFDIQWITEEIALQSTHGAIRGMPLSSLQRLLLDSLGERRFLMVLDDVWCESYEKWDILLRPLSWAGRGSWLIVTTRSQKVGANVARPVMSIPLMPLSAENCWEIFKRHAFVHGDSDSYPTLKEIGRQIVQKLGGVPLLARALGGFLVNRLEGGYWRNTLDVVRRYMFSDGGWPLTDIVLPSLQRSYRHLPPHLKLCFTYCSIFPKGRRFEKKSLVQMWMAQGFIQPVQHKRLEDIGNDCFDDLLQRSFFQHTDGYCVMPDLIHSLSQFNSTSECLMIGDGDSYIYEGVRHLSFSYNGSEHFELQRFPALKKVRTLVYLHELSSVVSNSVPCYLFGQLQCMRVLDLSNSEIKYLPDSVGNLKHLRFLDLSFTEIENLPDSLCSLHNLQTLKLVEGRWHRLPKGISNLTNLRYLDADAELFAGIAGIGKLTHLQELKNFILCRECGHGIGELKDMRELGGTLCIQNLDDIESGVEAGQAKLVEKLHLVELKLEWNDKFDANPYNDRLDEEAFEGLQPPPYIKVLEIKCNKGAKFPHWMETSLPSRLISISLYNCRKWETLPLLGDLPSLSSLKIGGMYGVKQVGREFYGSGLFPALNKLELEDMPELERWVVLDEMQLFPSLKTFHVIKCPRLKGLPRLPPSLTELIICEAGLHLPEMQTYELLPSPNLSLPEGLLHPLISLAKLDIRKCKRLVSLDLDALPSLKSLRIEECAEIEITLPPSKHWSSSIQHLDTDDGLLLTRLLPKTFSCLRKLVIHNCFELNSFADENATWEDLTKLEELYIWDCHNLISLPTGLGNFSSLLKLDIRGCPKVRCLPAKGLPPSLQHLQIGGCELLAESCHVGTGPDWPKVAHIPFLRIIGLEEDHGRGQKDVKNQLHEGDHVNPGEVSPISYLAGDVTRLPMPAPLMEN